ncbi:MAG TPA: alpha/beta hydrolase-fold protein [Nannocystis sp.]
MRASTILLSVVAVVAGCKPEGGAATEGATGTSWISTSFGELTTATTEAPTGSGGMTQGATSAVMTTDATSGEPTTGAATTGGPVMSRDEVLLRQAIAGEVDPVEAVRTIGERGGFPVETATGSFLFACLCGPGQWTLAGDHNGWTPEPLALAGPLYWIEAEIPTPDGSKYKFHEPASMAWIADPHGRRHDYDEYGKISYVRVSATHLERWYAIDGSSVGLGPRDLEVLVPQNGAFSRVLYAHDGQNLFDPEAIWGGWKLRESAPPGVLIVGIANTPARMDEYTPVPDTIDGQPVGGAGAAYAELVETVIRPRVEAAYGPAAVVGTMGSSLGGLISLVIADLYPDRYDMVISLSGTLGWGSLEVDGETILHRYAQAGKRDFAIYIDSGGGGTCFDGDGDGIEDDGDFNDNFCTNAQMYAILQSLGYTPGVDVFYVHAPGEPHNEAAWAGRVEVPLQIFAAL